MIKLVITKNIEIDFEDLSILEDEKTYTVVSTRNMYASTYFTQTGKAIKEFLEIIKPNKSEYIITINEK